jgi:transcriptional regulator with PAS, ATPase and Fis domain
MERSSIVISCRVAQSHRAVSGKSRQRFQISAAPPKIGAISARRSGPFYIVNCGAIPDGLLEAELFGYARGAFTGADPRGKAGLVELARGGTLLLDEVGDLPLGLQVKLLRFLESGEVWPISGSKSKHPDVRIIAATNRDIRQMIGEGTFRQISFTD